MHSLVSSAATGVTVAGHGDHERPLRILQVGPTAYRGGVTTAVLMLAKGLRQEGHEVMLVTDGGDTRELEALGVQCRVTKLSQKPLAIARGIIDTRRALRDFRPDVVHVHGRAPSLRSHLSGRRPDWFTLHSTHLTERVGWMDAGAVRRALSPLARRFFVLDESAREYLQHAMGIENERVEVVFNGVDCDRYRVPTERERRIARAQFGVRDGQTLVLFVGRLHAWKQPQAIVELARRTRAGHDQLRFAIVGEGELEASVRDAIAAAGVEDICTMHGWMDPLEAYFAADLLVMPSLHEGFGLVAVEAMATGCPVLRSRTGGSDRMIVEGRTGFCCGTDVESFILAGQQVLAEPRKLAAMRTDVREWVASRLSLRAQARTVVDHYRRHWPR